MSTDNSTCMQVCKGHRENLKLFLFHDISWLICAVRMGICNQTLSLYIVAASPSKVLLSHVCIQLSDNRPTFTLVVLLFLFIYFFNFGILKTYGIY